MRLIPVLDMTPHGGASLPVVTATTWRPDLADDQVVGVTFGDALTIVLPLDLADHLADAIIGALSEDAVIT